MSPDALGAAFGFDALRFAYPAALDVFCEPLWNFPPPNVLVRGIWAGVCVSRREEDDQRPGGGQGGLSQIFARAALPARVTWQPQREN